MYPHFRGILLVVVNASSRCSIMMKVSEGFIQSTHVLRTDLQTQHVLRTDVVSTDAARVDGKRHHTPTWLAVVDTEDGDTVRARACSLTPIRLPGRELHVLTLLITASVKQSVQNFSSNREN